MNRTSLWQFPVGLLTIVACTLGQFLAFASSNDPPKKAQDEPKAEESEEKKVWYQLVCVTIPPDSPHRKNTDLNKPPCLFVIFKKNGVALTRGSSWDKGWSVVFPDVYKNKWPVREGTGDLYTIEVWDYNYLQRSVMVFNKTKLKGEDFRKTIYEDGGDNLEMGRLATIEWREIPEPMEAK